MSRNQKKHARTRAFEALEPRLVMSAAFDVTHLTQLRQHTDYSNIDGSGVGIAVLDSGIYAANPDLKNNVKAFYNAVENAVPSSITAASVAKASDTEGHGTHVAGTAASSNPSIGVAYAANIVSVKVIADSGESSLGGDPLLRGLQFVARFADQFNIKVVNMSLGEVSSSGGVNENSTPSADDISAEIKLLEGLGITVVTASGNSYANNPTPGASYPAVVSTLSVASTWADSGGDYDFGTVAWGSSNDAYAAYENSATADIFSATSQRSTLSNQVAAPGVNIYSTWNNSSTDNSGSSLLYNTLSGTSMATPFVSGLVALIQDAAFTYGGTYFSDVSQIVSIIQNTSDKIVDSNLATNGRVKLVNGSPSTGTKYNLPETGDTFDRVNVFNAISYVRSLYSGTASTADLNATTAAATVLPSINGTTNYTRTGNLGTDGINNVGANDIDLYKISLISPGAFLFKLSGNAPFAATIRLFDSTGTQIAVATGTASSFPTLATDAASQLPIGTYYVGISSSGNAAYSVGDGSHATGGTATGAYALTVGATNPDPNGVAQGAVATDLTDPTTVLSTNQSANEYSGILGSDPSTDGSGDRVTVSDGDVDMFKVVAPDSGTLTIKTSTTGLTTPADTYLVVFDANLNQISFNDDISNRDTDSLISLTVVSGQTYYVAVTNYANRTFKVSDPYGRVAASTATATNYTLDFTFTNGDANGTAFLATTATVGATLTATVGSDAGTTFTGANAGNKDVDFYAMTPRSSGLLDLTATGNGSFSPSLSLWTLSSDGTSLTKVGSTTGPDAELIYAVTGSTAYYVSVTGMGNESFNWYSVGSGTGGDVGTYSLASVLRASSALSTVSDSAISDTPQTLTIGTPVYDTLGQDGAFISGDADVDVYAFTPDTTGAYDFRTDTSREGSADTVLRLFDASGNPIAINDNASASSTASFVRAALTAGTKYYIAVSGTGNTTYAATTGSGTSNGSTGSYGVMVTSASTPVVSLAGPATLAEPVPGATNTAVFTVTLDLPATAPVTVDFHTENGTGLAGTDFIATSGTLTFAPGETSKSIAVTLLSDAAVNADRTFVVGLSNASSNAIVGASSTVATITNFSVTTVTFTSKTPKTFTDSAGRTVTLRLAGPGTGSALFLSGNVNPAEINVTGTTLRSTLTISSSRGAAISNLTVTGDLGTLSASTTNLSGITAISGSLGTARLATATGAFSIGGTGTLPTFLLVTATNLVLTSAAILNSVTATTWSETTADGSILTAPAINKLTTKSFASELNLTAAGTTNLVSGSLGAATGTWTFAGSAGKLTATSLTNVQLSAASLASLSVTHSITSSNIRTTGNIGTITASTLASSTIFAGVNPTLTSLPTTAADLTASSTIGTVTIKGEKSSPFAVQSSDVAAAHLGRITFASIDPGNAGTPFGVAGDSLVLYRRKINGVVLSTKAITNLTDGGDALLRAL